MAYYISFVIIISILHHFQFNRFMPHNTGTLAPTLPMPYAYALLLLPPAVLPRYERHVTAS